MMSKKPLSKHSKLFMAKESKT